MRRWRGSSAVAVALVVTLAGAPLARTLPAECATCPPGCPMHARKQPRLGCHEGRGVHHRCGSTATGVATPGCGHAHELPGIALPPAVLPPVVVSWPAPVTTAHRPLAPTAEVGGADPPETPPPIAAR